MDDVKMGGIMIPAAKIRPDSTGQKQDTRFQPGQSGNPAGRPKGSRNKLGENFLNAFAQDFEQHGGEVIEQVRKERPQDYLKVAASLLPKQIDTETRRTRPLAELSDAELLGLVAEGIEDNVEAVLILRGHAPLTIAERQQFQNWEQECSGGGKKLEGRRGGDTSR